ncbi:MAG: transcription-repair coupling factor [Christensenellaceae bacterium]|nr:transcription-repair coupling factor [Christensenellaceae bacterium]
MSLSKYIQLNSLGGDFAELQSNVREGMPCSAFGIQFSHKCHIVSSLGLPVLYVTSTAVGAKQAAEEISELTDKKVVYLPPKDDVVLFKHSFNKESLFGRLTALYEIKNGAEIVVAPIESLMQLFPKTVGALTITENEEICVDEAVKALAKLGYSRVESVSEKGTFSLRGDILDVYPVNSEIPFRVNFFGDEVETICSFDESTGLKNERVKTFKAVAATDIFIDETERDEIRAKLKESYGKSVKNMVFTKSRAIFSELSEALESGSFADCLQFIMPLLKSSTNDIFDYIDKNAVVVFDECKLLKDTAESIYKEHTERVSRFLKSGEAYDFTLNQLLSIEEVLTNFNGKRKLALQSLITKIEFFNPLKTYKFNCTPVPRYSMRVGDAVTDIANWKAGGYRVIVCCAGDDRAKKLYSDLFEKRVTAEINDDFEEDFTGVKLTTFILQNGFVYHDAKLVVIGSGDLYLKSSSEKKIKKRRNDVFSAPSVGDYAVHEQHGVGIVRGTRKIETTSGVKDYISVEYAGGDMLYVSVEQMDKLTKYLAGDKKPTLNKIGGKDFEKVKERVRQSIKKMTINLKSLYRERAERHGFRFSEDDELMKLFEDSFEFEETEDQISSIEEIKKDMESDKVMDRLLCGDVGFGKTEVALRAAFKAVCDSKQVAIIAPTTILSQQHFNTCEKRFAGFGVHIDVINRFKTAAEQKRTLERVASGETDIIIGTHRLFGKDVKFKDLGLLILDEEQRFGVEHKERIKTMKVNVDTLTLSATPIPRTLHMSLTGIRDISTINTPPKTRLPVQTYVTEESDALVRDAVLREIGRGGQVFILYNRVESIYKYSEHLAEILPLSRIITAHGQMDEKVLEASVQSFYEGKADILVATTIIENGIDLPNANTLIVIDADKLGLSTLYQLKGRVGRGDRMAHAYFTFKPDKVMSESAYKRLTAIMEFTEMGSGFKIAMRDLEIRGAGNVLGREQHGHMEKVGYELYSRILREELGETTENFETELDVRAGAYIPEEYIPDSASRMDCYKQIAEIAEESDKTRVERSLTEVYGSIPKEVGTLIGIAVLKTKAKAVRAKKVLVKKECAEVTFASLECLDNEKLYASITANKNCASLSFKQNPVLRIEKPGMSAEQVLSFVTDFLAV